MSQICTSFTAQVRLVPNIDVVVNSITFNPTIIYVNEAFNMTVQVRNTGTAAGSGTVNFTVGGQAAGNPKPVTNLGAGVTINVTSDSVMVTVAQAYQVCATFTPA